MNFGTGRRKWEPTITDSFALVPLTRGLSARVDLSDLAIVAPYAWRATDHGYAATLRDRVSIYMHRLIVGAVQNVVVDHIDFDGLNNTRKNLRACTSTDNNRRRHSRSGKSRFKGAAFHRASGLFHSTIHVDGRQISLGYFRQEIDAARAYDEAARRYFRDFALTNEAMGLLA